MKNVKRRNTTLELLRILSMIGVLGLHYMNKNIGGGLTAALPANVLAAHVLESLCIISVNIFVLISGYFMINRKMTGLSKAVELYLIMLLYRLLFYAVGVYSGSAPFSWKGLLFAGIPFINGKLWFLETYMLLLLFAPFVNILIEHLNQNAHLLFIVLLFGSGVTSHRLSGDNDQK